MDIILRIFLTISSTSLLIIVFIVNNSKFSEFILFDQKITASPIIIGFLTLLLPLGITYLIIKNLHLLGHDSFNEGEIQEIQYANNSFLPSYLGYFFVALSINNWTSLTFIYLVLFIFTYKSQALYFNPIFLIFGFSFYNVKIKSGKTIFLITKEEIHDALSYSCQKTYRINDFTFIDRGDKSV